MIVNSQLYFELSITIAVVVDATIVLNDSSSTDICFPFFDKNLSNFEWKDIFFTSLMVRETTRIQSVVKWVPGKAGLVFFFF